MTSGQVLPVIRVGAMTAIPKELIADLEREKQALTIRNAAKIIARKGGFQSEAPDFYTLYKEDDRCLYTPRNHKVVLCPELVRDRHYQVLARTRLGLLPPINLGEDRVTLGPNELQPFDQGPAFEALVAPPTWPYGKTLVLRCGAGKTAIALKAAHARRARTLWVTITTTLLEQAKKDITKWLGIPSEEIGHVQAAKCDWRGRGIAVATAQSLALKEYPQAFYDYWDLLIFDEGDVLATEKFHLVAPLFRAERWLLTATKRRDDGMEALFEKHVGPVCYEYTEYDLVPDCHFVHTRAQPKKVLAYAGWDSLRGERRVCFPIVARKLLEDDDRNRQLFELVRKACEKGRTCLVLGGSVEGLAYACQAAKKALPDLRHGLVVGRVKQKERDGIIQGNDVVWATWKLAYRGLDRPSFDTLILATPTAAKKSVTRQTGGRILRAQPDKKPPIVVVMSDILVEPLAALSAKLARLFKQEKWPVHNAEKLLQLQQARIQAYRDEVSHG